MATADANTTGPFLDNFVSGKTGMIIMANWWEIALKAGMRDKFAEIATAPIPVGPAGIGAAFDLVFLDDRRERQGRRGEQKAAWDFLDWLNGPRSGPGGGSAMGDILMSMGILPSRKSDVAAFKERLASDPFRATSRIAQRPAFPVVLGGQELSRALQKHARGDAVRKETSPPQKLRRRRRRLNPTRADSRAPHAYSRAPGQPSRLLRRRSGGGCRPPSFRERERLRRNMRRTASNEIGFGPAMLAPAVGADRRSSFCMPMALTIWLSFQYWSTQTNFSKPPGSSASQNFVDMFGPMTVGSDFGTAPSTRPSIRGLSVALMLPLSVGLGRARPWQQARSRRRLRCGPMLCSPPTWRRSIAVALVFSKLYSPTEGPINQVLEWFGRRACPGSLRRSTALISTGHPQCLATGGLLHRARRSRA